MATTTVQFSLYRPDNMKTRNLFFLLFSGLLSCNPEKVTTQTDKDGVVTQLPFIWKSSISDGILGYGMYRGYVIDEKGILCVAMRKSKDKTAEEQYLQLKDVNTGQNLWEWDELFNKTIQGIIRQNIRLYDGEILLHGGSSDYLINTNSGTTIWKKKSGLNSVGPHPAYVGDKYFLVSNTDRSAVANIDGKSIFMGDKGTGTLTELTTPHYSEEYATKKDGLPYFIGSLINLKAFKRGEDGYLVVPHVEMGPVAKYNDNRSFFGLFNISQKKWVYDRIPLGFADEGAMASVIPIVNNDKIYLTSLNSIGCFELLTGKLLWQNRLHPNQASAMDMMLVQNKLIINCTNAKMYCVDADTGSQLWELQSSAMASDLYHQDGIVYWIRSKNLIAANLETGKILWDLPSLDGKEESRPDSWYGGFVTGIPSKDGKKGKIFATTNLNLYCFEAIR
jgi:outer membrane protein assembly factor BamB